MSEGKTAEFEEVAIEGWYRRKAHEFFRDFDDPFFNIAGSVDVTNVERLCRDEGLSFALTVLYCSQTAANSIEEFRLRLNGGKLVRYESVEATQTILLEDGSFCFCYFPWRDDLREYNELGREMVERYKALNTFDVEADRRDLIYYSVIPWISFTSFKHARNLKRGKTVPRIVFGKKYSQGGRAFMPVSVEANHAIMDGLQVGQYFERFQKALDECSC
ncbi:MAG: chloramphenicol acetyltransferase [Acidobacteria bacterium]|nr:MAG: chloramphenicol acetyltransferase [Acidobacteriota bacterium]REK01977.1 MAG: chloramphenicol acetyltransferase [Acidobacteriota bacterium]REK14934.1 MAG: chloramphenicol acetyltransferase [Acidobacteriota bacterium]REK45648.1 MAG: chloramphenicol acetyltransferase [Acidobacteriota bacterium]